MIKTEKKFTFQRQEKLKSSKLISELFRDGKALSVFPLRLVYLPVKTNAGKAATIQAGFTVSSRYFTKAHDRNRIKRLMRECYRLAKPGIYYNIKIEDQLALFFIYTGRQIIPFSELQTKFSVILSKLVKELNS